MPIKPRPLPRKEEILEYLSYDPETGIVTKNLLGRHRFKTETAHKIHISRDAGKVVGCKNKHGYLFAMINGVTYPLHRLIYVMHGGNIPDGKFVDHKNGVRDDNRWVNICDLVTWKQNTHNTKIRKDSMTGFKHVRRHVKSNGDVVYQVRLKVDGVDRSFGLYPTPEEAHIVALVEAKRLRGDNARTDGTTRH